MVCMMIVSKSFFYNGVLFPVGKEVDKADPVVAGREHLFDASVAPVEAATAAPGEKRSVAKKSAGKAKLAAKRTVKAADDASPASA
jgi:hypothetical protein